MAKTFSTIHGADSRKKHMNFITAALPVLVPLSALFIPGAVIARVPQHSDTLETLLSRTARAIVWSVTLLVLGTLLSTLLRLPMYTSAILAVTFTLFAVWRKRHTLQNPLLIRQLMGTAVVLVSIYALFCIPFLLYHDGLPTGDVQKAIFWATRILERNSFPDYAQASSTLNRDPVDFYTPGLHTFTALILSLTGDAKLSAIGFLAIALSIGISVIAAALTSELLVHERKIRFLTAVVTTMLVLTNLRFLRYLREPGYHFQNSMGELLLFGELLVLLALLRRWDRNDAVLAILAALALALTHQFSAFLGLFVLVPSLLMLGVTRWQELCTTAKAHRALTITLASSIAILITWGIGLGLHEKLPYLFTNNAHLRALVPTVQEYSQIMGVVWLVTGLAGLWLLGWLTITQRADTATMSFLITTGILLLLPQGPRFGIDIPPVRALFYSVVPLSVTGAYLITKFTDIHSAARNTFLRGSIRILVTVLVVAMSSATVLKAYALSHELRTNSTLTAEQLHIIDYLRTISPTDNAKSRQGEAILIDDYNRRSASWLILSGKPVFARLAADLERQMQESAQSKNRYNVYLKQLDYEKIYALGSRTETRELLAKHAIRWITGISDSSATSLAHNPELTATSYGGDVTVYEWNKGRESKSAQGTITPWLLKSTTLANDIGDQEDTFEHLPASLRATRLSDPIIKEYKTLRESTAPLIPLQFNVGDYIQVLWDKNNIGRPDIALELYLEFSQVPPDITVVTPTGVRTPVISHTPLRLDSRDVPFDTRGFITLTLHNPTEALIGIDLIALGLARTP